MGGRRGGEAQAVKLQLDLAALVRGPEGTTFERKSLFQGPPGQKTPRDRREVRDDIAHVVAAFANADGGVFVLGVEDHGTPTGHAFPADAIEDMLLVPERRLQPAQTRGERAMFEGHELLVFDVPSAPQPVMVDGNGYPVRVADSIQKMQAEKIAAWKQAGLVETWEARPSRLTLDQLDRTIIDRAIRGSKLTGIDHAGYLIRRGLAERTGDRLMLRRAAELMFARDSAIDHPNAGVRILRVIGTERKTGAAHNVEEIPRLEDALPVVLERAFAAIQPLLRHPSRLRGLRFEEVPEYPQFAWQEAIVNAVAHRDYALAGSSVEVWLFDDRMEVASPGGVVATVALDELRAGHRAHASRNPRIVRTLLDLGFMRDMGEGVPRMFGEMELLFLPPPQLDVGAHRFAVTLRNTPTITSETAQWLASLSTESMTEIQVRALVVALARGHVSNAALRDATGADTLTASGALRALRDHGLLKAEGAGPATYYSLGDRVPAALKERSGADRGGVAPDRGGLDADRGGVSHADDLPAEVVAMLRALGPRPRKDKLRALIVRLCEIKPRTPAELVRILGLLDPDKITERHLSPLVKAGTLRRTRPETPSHPEQAYAGHR